MGGVNVPTINVARISQASHEIDDVPGSVGIGKRVREVGSEYPARNSPKSGKPINRKRNNMARASFTNSTLSQSLRHGLGEIGSSYSLK